MAIVPYSQSAFRSSRLNGCNMSVVVDYVPKHQVGRVFIPYEKNLQHVKYIRETKMPNDTDLRDNRILLLSYSPGPAKLKRQLKIYRQNIL